MPFRFRRHGRVLVLQPSKVGAEHHEQLRRRGGRDGCGPAAVSENRHLAEEVPGAEACERPVLRGDDRGPFGEDEERVAGRSLTGQRYTCLGAPNLEPGGELPQSDSLSDSRRGIEASSWAAAMPVPNVVAEDGTGLDQTVTGCSPERRLKPTPRGRRDPGRRCPGARPPRSPPAQRPRRRPPRRPRRRAMRRAA